MARSVSVLRFVILGLISASVKSQGYQTGGKNSYYGSTHYDSLYNSGYYQQGLQSYHNPVFSTAAAQPYPDIYHQISVSSYHTPYPASNYYAQPGSHYSPNADQNSYYYSKANPYPVHPDYHRAAARPHTTTTSQPQPAVSGSSGVEEEQEMDEGGATGQWSSGTGAVNRRVSPVFNNRMFVGPQRGLPAWPFEPMTNTSPLSASTGRGRNYLLPHAVGGQGLLEAVTSAQRLRQRSRPLLSNRNNFAANPMFLMLAFDGFLS